MGARDPETPRQAERWEVVKNKALAHGLCVQCASQLAWGHQAGFASIHPPCPQCADLVATLPKERPNGWRTVTGSANGKWTSTPTPGGNRVRVGSGRRSKKAKSHTDRMEAYVERVVAKAPPPSAARPHRHPAPPEWW